jgi:PAS domain S-box-containing protein
MLEKMRRRYSGDTAPGHYDFAMLTKSGEKRWVEFSVASIEYQGQPAMIGTGFDVTERKRAEEALGESEKRYRLLFERNPDGVFTVDTGGRFLLVNAACEWISGYGTGELLQMAFMDLCAPDQLAQTVEAFQRTLTEPHHYLETETALIRKDGRRVELWTNGEALIHEGKVVGVHCTVKDITARKRAEAALRESEWFIKSITEASPNSLLASHSEITRFASSTARPSSDTS